MMYIYMHQLQDSGFKYMLLHPLLLNTRFIAPSAVNTSLGPREIFPVFNSTKEMRRGASSLNTSKFPPKYLWAWPYLRWEHNVCFPDGSVETQT
jgi:hypothetical protein